MNIKAVRFNVNDRPEFIKELHAKVNAYFKEKGISKKANVEMYVKTLFMTAIYLVPLAYLIFGGVDHFVVMYIMYVLMALGVAGIGLSVMHDANHGSYSKNPSINKFFGFFTNLIGGYHVNWKIQHNVLHHTFTNIEEYDEDIEKAVFRFSAFQKNKPMFKYQAYYATFFYGLMTIYWLLAKDFIKIAKYYKLGLFKSQGLSLGKAIFEIVLHKIWYVAIAMILPFMTIQLPFWQILIGYLSMHFIAGVILAYVFQPAHLIEDTHTYVPDEKTSVENSWAIHQLKTTANFANKNSLLTWFLGGLNHQVEHHLFPQMCHVHYPKIAPIVKQVAKKYNIPYYEFDTFHDAIKSHLVLLDKLGSGKHDHQLSGQIA